MLLQRWASVADDGPTLKQHWVNVTNLLGFQQRGVWLPSVVGQLQEHNGPVVAYCWAGVVSVGPLLYRGWSIVFSGVFDCLLVTRQTGLRSNLSEVYFL